MKFYVLKSEGGRFGTKWAYADILDPQNTEDVGPRCPVCGETVGPLVWLLPHRIKLASAKPEKWGDFLWGAGFGLMVSERFKQIYEQEGLRGIVRFWPPVEIVRMGTKKTGDLVPQPPTYYLIEINWDGAAMDEKASEVVVQYPEKPECSYCRQSGRGRLKQKGIILETGSWKGDDIFHARGAGGILVSERFKEVAERYRLKNVLLISAERYAYDAHRPHFPLHYVRED